MTQKAIHINNPDEPGLADAYRSLPRMGEISVSALIINMGSIFRSLESTGFIGMEVVYLNYSSGVLNIRAYKGKNGPCYNTGRKVVYQGEALAALDDDNHLIFTDHLTPVCEKTAMIYRLPGYEKLVKCSDANPDLMEKLDNVPEIFSCDTFEEDQERLFQSLMKTEKTKDLTGLFYPGPFRLLILKDGRIVKRGLISMIPEPEAGQLIKRDGLFKIENYKNTEPQFFQELYISYGARCLIDKYNISYEQPEEERIQDLTSLERTSPELKERLLKLIKNNNKYFILTGSDLRDTLGCCPSEVVTGANRLVSAGILDSHRNPAPGETCPVSIYAFRNEMKITDNNLQFNIDNDFRQLILKKLDKKMNSGFRILTRWILLAFILITLTIALLKFYNSSSPAKNLSLYEQLVPQNNNQLMIILFHYSERCNQCLNMEKYTNDVLTGYYSDLVTGKKLQFKLMIMDNRDNQNLVERFGLFTTTIVLVQFENKQEKRIKVLNDSWKYSQDEQAFKNMIKKELDQFINNNYE